MDGITVTGRAGSARDSACIVGGGERSGLHGDASGGVEGEQSWRMESEYDDCLASRCARCWFDLADPETSCRPLDWVVGRDSPIPEN